MMVNKWFVNRLKNTYNIFHSEELKVKYRMDEKSFTRNRKLGFADTMTLIVTSCKKGLQVSIDTFLRESGKNITYTKQAFSKARQNINPEVFCAVAKGTNHNFYDYEDFNTYHGYRVLAIDGTSYTLPCTDELCRLYGGQDNGKNIMAIQAKSSCLYDVLNRVILDSCFVPYLSNERVLAAEHLKQLRQFKSEETGEKAKEVRELILMDRGYPSKKLFDDLLQSDFSFLVRCPQNGFIREIRHLETEDSLITYTYKKKQYTLRALNLVLDSGNNEILLTNILDTAFTANDFKSLYGLRWKIETRYGDLKEKLEIETFSGYSSIAVLQDFYATVFLSNMVALAQMQCDSNVFSKNEGKNLKYDYKTSTKATVEYLRPALVKMLLVPSGRKQKHIFYALMNQLEKNVVPIREGRSFPRKRKICSFPLS